MKFYSYNSVKKSDIVNILRANMPIRNIIFNIMLEEHLFFQHLKKKLPRKQHYIFALLLGCQGLIILPLFVYPPSFFNILFLYT